MKKAVRKVVGLRKIARKLVGRQRNDDPLSRMNTDQSCVSTVSIADVTRDAIRILIRPGHYSDVDDVSSSWYCRVAWFILAAVGIYLCQFCSGIVLVIVCCLPAVSMFAASNAGQRTVQRGASLVARYLYGDDVDLRIKKEFEELTDDYDNCSVHDKSVIPRGTTLNDLYSYEVVETHIQIKDMGWKIIPMKIIGTVLDLWNHDLHGGVDHHEGYVVLKDPKKSGERGSSSEI